MKGFGFENKIWLSAIELQAYSDVTRWNLDNGGCTKQQKSSFTWIYIYFDRHMVATHKIRHDRLFAEKLSGDTKSKQ